LAAGSIPRVRKAGWRGPPVSRRSRRTGRSPRRSSRPPSARRDWRRPREGIACCWRVRRPSGGRSRAAPPLERLEAGLDEEPADLAFLDPSVDELAVDPKRRERAAATRAERVVLLERRAAPRARRGVDGPGHA